MRNFTIGERARAFFAALQDEICAELERLDGRARFSEDRWNFDDRPQDGGGVTRVISGGAVFEKGGVNFSDVRGTLSPRLAARMGVEARPFAASGLSLVLHPESPKLATVHMNVRYIELPALKPGAPPHAAWFGGGADLTPYYLDERDARQFHAAFRRACDAHGPELYPRFKRQCDDYFWLKHRAEARGVGGIFFDDLRDDLEAAFAFVRDVGRAFLDAYPPIVERHRDEPWDAAERAWQLVRRGRYVEFNLVHDRGTLFGLETGGRTESILMSLPPLVAWSYDHAPQPGSAEERLLDVLRRPREWA